MFNEKDQLAIDTIRALSIDAIEEANSGHSWITYGSSTNGLYFMDTPLKF